MQLPEITHHEIAAARERYGTDVTFHKLVERALTVDLRLVCPRTIAMLAAHLALNELEPSNAA